ncbi:hypothetical protein QLQ12_05960 [Actinoplanes sp. NEAU-A12]|uniref:DUF4333 domain-containing protein n=1 Tax=Actinoplanes sandaracinus TaxID=3045177 RepID=A0ABT6WEJ3_9ACTN|nr:hypothetical protein [Actinoplanes sandaracinus]MDI6098146.1 hypothetical protein [Actinoplanes sandaracinus]
MTVQTPQEPGHYPSAPPWATPPEPAWEPAPPHTAALFGGSVPPYDSPDYKHGQLLVPFPGEVQAGHRPDAPSWWPVVLWTLMFSALGVLSALRRSAQAHRFGRARRPYWIAFGATLLAGAAFWSALTFGAAIPLYRYHEESGITARLQTALVSDARITKRFGTVSAVECTPEGDRTAEGLRTYLCTVQLSTGKANGLYVEAGTEGDWQEKE